MVSDIDIWRAANLLIRPNGDNAERVAEQPSEGSRLLVGEIERHDPAIWYAWQMISDLDVWRAANLLIRKHRADAEIEARRIVDAGGRINSASPTAAPAAPRSPA